MPSSQRGNRLRRRDSLDSFDDVPRTTTRDSQRGRARRPSPVRFRSSSYNGRDRRYRDASYDSYDSYDDIPRSRRQKSTRSSGGRRHRSATRHRSPSRKSSRSRSMDRSAKADQAVRAALTAGALEAIKQRKNPGGWVGSKGARVATAAISAAAIDVMVDKDPGRKKTRHTAGATIGGLMVDRLLNGKNRR